MSRSGTEVDLPPFANPNSFDSLQVFPPFFFDGVTTRMFPLRASMPALQHVLDNYINKLVPPEIGRFRVACPYVYLMVLNYGKLAAPVANIGWIAQREVMFLVPAYRYVRQGDRWTYRQLMWFSPLMFVDSDPALTLGRRVYGWPKLGHRLEPTISAWTEDPSAAVARAVYTTDVYGKPYEGREKLPRVYMEIMTLSGPESDGWIEHDSPLMPWTIMSQAAEAMAGVARDAATMMTSFASSRAFMSPEAFFSMATNLLGQFDPNNLDAGIDTINLKQFRDCERPHNYCYQALTAALMRVTAVNRFGLLGTTRRVGLDASGGYRIRIHDWPSLSIVSQFGLDVERSWRGQDVDVFDLRPVCPFWYDADIVYERGRNFCWRGGRSADRDTQSTGVPHFVWHGEDGHHYSNPDRTQVQGVGTPHGGHPRTARPNEIEQPDDLYNTTLAAWAHRRGSHTTSSRHLATRQVPVGWR